MKLLSSVFGHLRIREYMYVDYYPTVLKYCTRNSNLLRLLPGWFWWRTWTAVTTTLSFQVHRLDTTLLYPCFLAYALRWSKEKAIGQQNPFLWTFISIIYPWSGIHRCRSTMLFLSANLLQHSNPFVHSMLSTDFPFTNRSTLSNYTSRLLLICFF